MKLLELITHAGDAGLTANQLAQLNAELAGMERAIGIHYTRVDPEGVAAQLEVGENHLQPVGLVNGGVFATLAESVGSVAGLVLAGGRPVVGVNNNTDFIAPVKTGVIEATTEPIQTGKRTQLWQISMTNHGRLVARSTLRTMVLD